ncbi:hypothetical protein ASE01_20165 [Nocardioides sp. Root190]|uniref:helix-turn-helix domain-containing protein n=1 Tax=Nocardioides sp. Root190 TaxID=1736488 RepID=UPI0006FAC432|nr:helix-turn-helix domain-containing protein [Nocardioides sp. Root190]KRB73093.1 hypothetical protein ASE01_20165 [Nocardioides sp. Root190]
MSDDYTPEEARQLLQQIGAGFAKAEGERQLAMQRLQVSIRAFADVVPISQIAELTGLSRPTVYKVLEEWGGGR